MRDVEKFNSITLSAINDFIFAFGFPFTDTCTIYKTLSIDSVAFWEYTVKAEITQSYHAILWLSTSFFTFQMTLFSSSLYSIIFFPTPIRPCYYAIHAEWHSKNCEDKNRNISSMCDVWSKCETKQPFHKQMDDFGRFVQFLFVIISQIFFPINFTALFCSLSLLFTLIQILW